MMEGVAHLRQRQRALGGMSSVFGQVGLRRLSLIGLLLRYQLLALKIDSNLQF
jgi:hypothetical protein